jgi:hypothetical protein
MKFTYEDDGYFSSEIFFAVIPRRLFNGEWAWLTWLKRTWIGIHDMGSWEYSRVRRLKF